MTRTNRDDRSLDVEARFEAWRRKGDADALAEVFDALAPGLLRLGVHLVGRADRAEDLVQATFLTVIERPGMFEPSRGDLAGFLGGVLGRKARADRRDAARAPDPTRLAARVADTPLSKALDAERSGALAKAIDELPEPYRAAMILRLRHGLSPADVAHTLGISPGAARTRLSRGADKLRRLLPTGLATPGLVVALSELADFDHAVRGLDAVRRVVLERAAELALTTGASTLTVGGILMTKKLLAVAAAIVALAATFAWHRLSDASPRPGATAAPTDTAVGTSEVTRDDDAIAGAPEMPAPRKAEVGASPPGTAAGCVEMRGRVIDEESGQPVVGAEVLLVAARPGPISEIRSDPTVRVQLHNGSPLPYGSVPRIDGDLFQVAAELDTIAPRVFRRPTTDEIEGTDARARSDSSGAFTLLVPAEGGTLLCRHPDYPDRALPAPEPEHDWTIALRRLRRFSGVVLDRLTDTPVGEELDLVLWGALGSTWGRDDETGEPRERAATVAHALRTDATGRFEIELPLQHAQVEILSAGWICELGLVAAQDPDGVVFARRAPQLVVTDAETGVPVERIRLLGTSEHLNRPKWCAELRGAGGRYALVHDRWLLDQLSDDALKITVWSDGYAATHRTIPSLADARDIEIALKPGDVPAVHGQVLLGGEPAAGAQVLLQAHDALQWNTNLDGARSVDGVRTNADGRFRVSAPAGNYVLRVALGSQVFAEVVELPDGGLARSIDLYRLGAIEVVVVDPAGTHQPDHTVVLRDEHGRQEWSATDAEGRARFDLLAAGTYSLVVPRVATKGSFGAGLTESVELRGQATERVEVVIPSSAARYARVVCAAEADLTRIRARVTGGAWLDLEADGRIPFDLASRNHVSFELEHEAGQRWSVDVPLDAPDGYTIALYLEGPAFEGELVDRLTGAPLAGVWVQGRPMRAELEEGANPPGARVRTDARGRFRLISSAAVPHTLTFAADGQRLDFSSFDRTYGGTSFRTRTSPSLVGTPLTIRLAAMQGERALGHDARDVRGVLRRVDGTPADGAMVWFRGEEEQADGRLSVWSLASRGTTDGEGRFDVPAPGLPLYAVLLFADPGGPPTTTVDLAAEGAALSALELYLP